ncbi:MAG: hypothetical protein Q9N34_08470 [Aquificota bacterium]|nr:hypothetical protein [Aquificota bacterium]
MKQKQDVYKLGVNKATFLINEGYPVAISIVAKFLKCFCFGLFYLSLEDTKVLLNGRGMPSEEGISVFLELDNFYLVSLRVYQQES